MPGSAREVSNAEEEGVEFVWLSSPKEFKGTNKIEKLIIDKIQLGEPDDSGRRKPEIKEGSEFEIKADMVIKALGFDPEDLPYLFDSKELQVTKWGTLKTNFDTMETNLEGVFAAILAWLILDQFLNEIKILGIFLILVAVIFSQLAPLYDKRRYGRN